jgi:hypothetical protein
MPEFISLFRRKSPDIQPNHVEGITSDGRVVLRDRRGTRKAEVPNVNLKSETLGDDPRAIYKPTDAKHVDAAKANLRRASRIVTAQSCRSAV